MSRVMPRTIVPAGPLSGALVNVGFASVLFLGALILLLHSGSTTTHPPLNQLSVLFAAISTFPICLWRRFPVVAFATIAAASIALTADGFLLELPIGLTVALYLFTASRPRGAPWNWRTAGLVSAVLIAYLGAEAAGQQRFPALVEFHTCLVWAVAWFAGERTRLQNAHISQLQERALAMEREAEKERELAAAMERARIARDLHDSAGHAISVIAVRAGAARLRHHRDPDRSLSALEAIEGLARQTVQEIDQLVGTLREGVGGEVEVEAPLGLASLPTLIAQRSAAGLAAKLEVSGSKRPLVTAVDQAVYRIVQEALTNASRHGDGDAKIDLNFGEKLIDVRVTNSAQRNGRSKSGGNGLIGMRERATLLGGSFCAEHRGEAFVVHVRIPYGGSAIDSRVDC